MVTDVQLEIALDSRTVSLVDGYDRTKHPTAGLYRYLTPDEARSLKPGDEVPFTTGHGWCKRVRVSGKVQTWKRDASRVEVPCKFGLYESARFVAREGRMEAWGDARVRLLVRV